MTPVHHNSGAENSWTKPKLALTNTAIAAAIQVSVSGTDVLVMYTWNGDADLNGKVNADDYFIIDSNYNKNLASPGWVRGDFDYSGAINGDDYTVIDAGFSGQHGTILTAGGVDALSGVAAVPEPASVVVLALGGAAALMRRRRR